MDWNTFCFNVATLIAGVFVLDYGADKFIDHTVIVGRRLGIITNCHCPLDSWR